MIRRVARVTKVRSKAGMSHCTRFGMKRVPSNLPMSYAMQVRTEEMSANVPDGLPEDQAFPFS